MHWLIHFGGWTSRRHRKHEVVFLRVLLTYGVNRNVYFHFLILYKRQLKLDDRLVCPFMTGYRKIRRCFLVSKYMVQYLLKQLL